MLEMYLPYLIGLALGFDAPSPSEQITEAQTQSDPVVAAVREPEPQIPTGQFTTATEIRPIVSMTKSNWVAVRHYDGQDLLYFTHLLSWRCGLWDISYSINNAPDLTAFPMEPCHEGTNSPNAMVDVANYLPFVGYPPESIQTIYVEITLDDGTTDFAQFSRSEVLIP